MPIFAAIITRGQSPVVERLKLRFDGRTFAVKDDVWLVAYEGTTQKLAEELGIRDGSTGSGLVIPVSNYSGRATPDLWEWLQVHWPSH